MDQKDLKAIGNLLDKKLVEQLDKKLKPINETLEYHSKQFEKIEAKLDVNTASVMKIEQKIGAALELRVDVSEVHAKVANHEKRLTNVEENLNLIP